MIYYQNFDIKTPFNRKIKKICPLMFFRSRFISVLMILLLASTSEQRCFVNHSICSKKARKSEYNKGKESGETAGVLYPKKTISPLMSKSIKNAKRFIVSANNFNGRSSRSKWITFDPLRFITENNDTEAKNKKEKLPEKLSIQSLDKFYSQHRNKRSSSGFLARKKIKLRHLNEDAGLHRTAFRSDEKKKRSLKRVSYVHKKRQAFLNGYNGSFNFSNENIFKNDSETNNKSTRDPKSSITNDHNQRNSFGKDMFSFFTTTVDYTSKENFKRFGEIETTKVNSYVGKTNDGIYFFNSGRVIPPRSKSLESPIEANDRFIDSLPNRDLSTKIPNKSALTTKEGIKMLLPSWISKNYLVENIYPITITAKNAADNTNNSGKFAKEIPISLPKMSPYADNTFVLKQINSEISPKPVQLDNIYDTSVHLNVPPYSPLTSILPPVKYLESSSKSEGLINQQIALIKRLNDAHTKPGNLQHFSKDGGREIWTPENTHNPNEDLKSQSTLKVHTRALNAPEGLTNPPELVYISKGSVNLPSHRMDDSEKPNSLGLTTEKITISVKPEKSETKTNPVRSIPNRNVRILNRISSVEDFVSALKMLISLSKTKSLRSREKGNSESLNNVLPADESANPPQNIYNELEPERLAPEEQKHLQAVRDNLHDSGIPHRESYGNEATPFEDTENPNTTTFLQWIIGIFGFIFVCFVVISVYLVAINQYIKSHPPAADSLSRKSDKRADLPSDSGDRNEDQGSSVRHAVEDAVEIVDLLESAFDKLQPRSENFVRKCYSSDEHVKRIRNAMYGIIE